ncbi:S-adenosyl-L-methionine-dependent methyltransferase [Phlyctochytrium arcticum]|nr:S-adenosyl-L-methionine-dependent methyltransferase [Phlyctochytrium arcticum]
MRAVRPNAIFRSNLSGLVEQLASASGGDQQAARQEIRWMVENLQLRRSRSDFSFLRPTTQSAPLKSSELLGADSSLSHYLGRNCSTQEIQRIERWLYARVHERKPLQYLLRTQPFCDLEFRVRPPTLIPRWETEEWTMRLLTAIKQYNHPSAQKPLHILDICTGSGCIGLSLAHHLAKDGYHVKMMAVDISPSAIQLAKVNARRVGVPESVLAFRKVDIMDENVVSRLRGSQSPGYDIITSNPPYITEEEYIELDDDVKLWEDEKALAAPNEGIAFHQRISQLAFEHLLRPDPVVSSETPRLLMEIGHKQKELATRVTADAGFRNVKVWDDLARRPRCVVAFDK